MTTVVTMGSCLGGLTTLRLSQLYGWEALNNCAVARSDFFADYLVDQSATLPSRETILSVIQWKPEMMEDGLRWLDECYRDKAGHLDTPADKPALFENLATAKIDVILLDNLADTYNALTCARPGAFDTEFCLPLSLSRCENEQDLAATTFTYGPVLTPEQSIDSWVRIVKYLRQMQPRARIFFFCAHASENLHSPDRVERTTVFARKLPAALAGLDVRVIPALELSREMMADGDHYAPEVYSALAGQIFLEEIAGWRPDHAAAAAPRGPVPASAQTPAPKTKPAAADAEKFKVICDEEALDKRRSVVSPYSDLPDSAFWRRSIARLDADQVDPVVNPRFAIGPDDQVATAGSCFAQHISRTLQAEGYKYLVTEPEPLTAGAAPENFGVFPARFANIYTVRQLLQLFLRAYGRFEPRNDVWRTVDGVWLDAHRPQIQQRGYASEAAAIEDRVAHLAAVRRMFEDCQVFIFTLGLTEGWMSQEDGAVYPTPPGAVGVAEASPLSFVNFTAEEMTEDLRQFIGLLREVNRGVRILLTVSPVPLIATYEPRHVLVSTTYSKSALRVTADAVSRSVEDVEYFPSYEIITGAYNHARFFEDDLREVSPEGVASVMAIFKRHYIEAGAAAIETAKEVEAAEPA